jgi:tetratricopeptide (TPR) repeat protein
VGRLLAWLGVAGGATYLVFIGGAWWGIYLPQLRIITVSIITIAIAIWAWVAWRDPSWRPRSVLLPAILVCLGSLAISTVFSRDPRVSVEYLSYSVLLAAGYLLLVRLFAHPFFRDRIANLASLLFVVIATTYLVLNIADWIRWFAAIGHLAIPPLRPDFEALTYGNPSAVLTIVALLGATAAANWARDGRRGIAVVSIVGLLVAVVALISGSRSGWFALASASVILAVLWIAAPSHRRLIVDAVGSIGRSRLAGPIAAVALLAIAGVVVLLLPSILRRAGEGGEDLRASYVAIAFRLFGQSPIVGTGPGTWVLQRIHETLPTETDSYIPHAHDVPAQTLAELGLIGALAGALLLVSVVWLFARAARSDDPSCRRWAWLGGGALIYLAFHDLLDFYLNFPSILLPAAIPVAFLDARTPRRYSRRGRNAEMADEPAGSVAPDRRRTYLPVAGLGVAALACAFALGQELPALAADRSVAAANQGDFAAALEPARSAAQIDPSIGSYEMTYGLIADRLGDHQDAAQAFGVVATHDDLPEAWLDLAAEQVGAGKPDEAILSIRTALRLGIQRPSVALPAGDLSMRLGEKDLAKQAFEASLANAPSLAADPWWVADPSRRSLLPILIRDLATTNPPIGWQLALMSGDANGAAGLATRADIGEANALRIIAAWRGTSAATEEVVSLCRAYPYDTSLLGWCARLEARRGNETLAATFRDLSNVVNGGSFVQGAEVRVTEDVVINRALGGDPATYWGFYTYRRATPYDLLVQSLPHLVFE